MCIDILLITETWLDSTIPDSLLSCQNNFVCFREDRDRFGGGVCISVNSALNTVPDFRFLYLLSFVHLRLLS